MGIIGATGSFFVHRWRAQMTSFFVHRRRAAFVFGYIAFNAGGRIIFRAGHSEREYPKGADVSRASGGILPFVHRRRTGSFFTHGGFTLDHLAFECLQERTLGAFPIPSQEPGA